MQYNSEGLTDMHRVKVNAALCIHVTRQKSCYT